MSRILKLIFEKYTRKNETDEWKYNMEREQEVRELLYKGHIENAISLSKEIFIASDKCKAYISISKSLADKGDIKKSKDFIKKSIKEAEWIKKSDNYYSALNNAVSGEAYIAKIEAINSRSDAKKTIKHALVQCEKIKDDYGKSSALYYIIKAQLCAGLIDNAILIAENINDRHYKSNAWLKITKYQITNNLLNEAKQSIEKSLKNSDYSDSELSSIIEIKLNLNEIDEAIELSKRIRDEQYKDRISKLIDESKNGKIKLKKGESSHNQNQIENQSESTTKTENTDILDGKSLEIKRGFEIIGGTFVYKVKVLNNTPHRVNDIKIQVLSYPNDCLKADTTERTVSKVEPNGGFRSLEFKFTPTHDCVQGVVNSLVTYIDSTETLQTQVVEPIVIKSVCDLLKPLEGSKYEILDIIDKLKAGAQDEITIADSASEMFQRFLDVLPDRNFAITDSDSKELGGRFMGNITAAARGKYTNENIGLKITVLDNGDGGCTVHFKACGNDSSMLPTAVEEVKQILDTKALLVMNIMRTLNVIREACKADTAHSVLTKLEELKVKIDGEVEVSAVEKLDNVMRCEVMYDSVEEQLKEHDVKKICVYCDHLEGMLEVGLVKK